MSEFVNARDVSFKFFSERLYKNVDICVDDIVTIYEDDSLEIDDVDAVDRLVERFVKICKNERIGSLGFCVSARDELSKALVGIENSASLMRRFVGEDLRERSFRKVTKVRERTKIIDSIRIALEDLNVEIDRRSFVEGGY